MKKHAHKYIYTIYKTHEKTRKWTEKTEHTHTHKRKSLSKWFIYSGQIKLIPKILLKHIAHSFCLYFFSFWPVFFCFFTIYLYNVCMSYMNSMFCHRYFFFLFLFQVKYSLFFILNLVFFSILERESEKKIEPTHSYCYFFWKVAEKKQKSHIRWQHMHFDRMSKTWHHVCVCVLMEWIGEKKSFQLIILWFP